MIHIGSVNLLSSCRPLFFLLRVMALSHVVAFVTGAGSGLGRFYSSSPHLIFSSSSPLFLSVSLLFRATAIRLAAQGAKVIVADISADKVNHVVTEIGSSALPAIVDVCDEKSVSHAISEAVSRWGNLNATVNCAGIGIATKTLSKKGPHDLQQFSNVLRINTVGTFNVLRLTAEAMTKNEPDENGQRGVIINTASIAAMDGQSGQAAYAASKGAIVSMTLPIARDLSSVGIRVNAIAPGLFLTPMLEGLPEPVRTVLASTVPFPKRLGKPAEYAQLVQSIIENPMLNGEVIRLDGALRMGP
jgi:3-hydroxyacyl-CoA dehydrogenase / 3-hydroxy-2-methylbutyryl-CoA dehydrogenase